MMDKKTFVAALVIAGFKLIINGKFITKLNYEKNHINVSVYASTLIGAEKENVSVTIDGQTSQRFIKHEDALDYINMLLEPVLYE